MKYMIPNLLFLLILMASCHKSGNTGSATDIPAVYTKIYGATDMYIDGDYLVVKSNGRPDHKSPYYQGTQWADSLYEPYTGTNSDYAINPNRIATANLTFRIPLHPQKADNPEATPLGPIGISLNGVPFYNQYAGGGQPLTGEVNSFDQYNGHPQQMGGYHYHEEPLYLTGKYGKDALLGFLLDGYPVYGPLEDDSTMTDAGLDECHGHFGPTPEFPNGIYHYHITAEAPYINGSGFYGVAGTVSQ